MIGASFKTRTSEELIALLSAVARVGAAADQISDAVSKRVRHPAPAMTSREFEFQRDRRQ